MFPLNSTSPANSSSTSNKPSIDVNLVKLQVTVNLVVGTLALVANAVVIARIAHCRRYYIVVHQVILHLAVADILFIITQLLAGSAWTLTVNFYGGSALCKIYFFVRDISQFEMTLLIVVVSLDRASCIRCRRNRPTRYLLYASWAVSCMCGVPSLITYEVNNFPKYNITQCVHASWYKASTWRRVNYFLSMFFFYVAPVVIIVASYAIIIGTLRRWKTKNLHGNNGTIVKFHSSLHSSSTDESGRLNTSVTGPLSSAPVSMPQFSDRRWGLLSRAQRLILIMATSIVGSFLLLWTPFFVVNLLAELTDHKTHSKRMVWAHWLQGLNALVNPIIYGIFTRRRQSSSEAARARRRAHQQRRLQQQQQQEHQQLHVQLQQQQKQHPHFYNAERQLQLKTRQKSHSSSDQEKKQDSSDHSLAACRQRKSDEG